ncbi:hypothetical protein SAMN05444007_1179 [Cribrihabitans marinus]|uniref:Lipoprotein n=1 Tax=Cribrihabitans marinus TaxID=1227549 RepID=A0A1H7E474_9RHOB|nr:hypothetical protein SAMN05444007_1179 [Cribrihabitans marinus]
MPVRGSALMIFLLGGCVAQDVGPVAPSARFEDPPTRFLEAFEASCIGPAREFRELSTGALECREFMAPAATAAAIVEYDGYPQDLPQLVIRFLASEDAPGYRVDSELFLNVPQRTGLARRIAPSDPRITRQINRLYRAAGGEPM